MKPVRRKYIPDRPLLVIALLAMSTTFWFLERSSFSWGFSWHYGLAAILVAWYLRMLLRDNRAATLTSFYQHYYFLGMLASAAIVASGAPMIEIGAHGSPNGFFWLMLGFFIVGIEATLLGYRSGNLVWLRWSALRFPPGVDRVILLAFILPSLLLSAYVFLLTGGPVLSGVDRTTFWRTMAPSGTSILPSLITQSFFFVPYIYLWHHRSKKKMLLPQLILISYILIGLLVLGQKFSLFIAFLNIWLIALVGIQPNFRFDAKYIIWAGVISILLVTIIIASYLLQDREAAFILVRAALQSQLLWSIAEDTSILSLLPQRPECFFGCDWFKDGPDYISFYYLPLSTYIFYNEGGTVLSGFMPALPILTLGAVITLFLHILICFNLGITQRKIVESLNQRQPIYGFLLFKLQFGITMVWFGAIQTAIFGLAITLAAIIIYRFVCIVQSDTRHSALQRV